MTMTTDVTPYDSAVLTDALALVESGKITLAEAALRVREAGTVEVAPTRKVVAFKVAAITEAQRASLTALPSVYGQVVPTERRILTPVEITALMRERDEIDAVLALAKKRKEGTLRETLANHFDVALEDNEGFDPETPIDDKGHYICSTPQEVEAEGTGRKFVMSASNPSPTVDSALLEAAHLAGIISRPDYLALTSLPEVARVFDQDKARKAIKANPALLSLVARAAKAGTPVNTLRISNA